MAPQVSKESGVSQSDLEYIINHVILPPRCPQEAEEDPRDHHSMLLKFLLEVAQDYTEPSEHPYACNPSETIVRVLGLTLAVHGANADFTDNLKKAISQLGLMDCFGLHISAQNACIIFRRVPGGLRLEVFEASPISKAVVSCNGRLKITYPGPATMITWEVATDQAFLEQLGSFLSHMDTHIFTEDTVSKSRKAGGNVSESRDTTNPRYIIELFTGMMRGIGGEVSVDRITKSIRDEVNWNSAKKPWRRSPVWTLVRVAMQTTVDKNDYKCFMLEIMRNILAKAIELDFGSYTISCINKKLARRVHKLEDDKISPALLENIRSTTEKASKLVFGRWQSLVSRSDRSVLWDPELGINSNINKNTILPLPKATELVRERLEAYLNPVSPSLNVVDPIEEERYLDEDTFPIISSTFSEWEMATRLVDFEHWIKVNLKNWCDRNEERSIVEILSEAIEDYHIKAKGFYKADNVLNNSIMLLTILEMWVQLDKATCGYEPLLLRFPPGIPHNLLDPILLVQLEDMERLDSVEKYIKERAYQSNRPSIFSPSASTESFSYLYYQTSNALQSLRRKIVIDAEAERAKKERELNKANEEHSSLLSQYRRMTCDSHEFISKKGKFIKSHPKWCNKCAILKKANNMRIEVHEWPLPEKEDAARSVLFELQPPREFMIWRNITYYVMVNVCSTSPVQSQGKDRWGFEKWADLSRHQNLAPRITLCSTAKPFLSSHYATQKIPALERDVLLKHAGVYRLFDTREKEWVEYRHNTATTDPYCKSTISDPSYRDLAYAVNSVNHTHNEVIAGQHKCPSSLTLREYEAFASLRSGSNLQWHNLLVELRKDDLSLKQDSVFTLILHATCHAGPSSVTNGNLRYAWIRDSHIELSDETFSSELLKTLNHILDVIKDNWEQANTLKILVLLARRLLSCGDASIESDTIDFLRRARRVCHPWVEEIRFKLETTFEGEKAKHFRTWLLKILSTQCSTFDVDSGFLPEAFEEMEDAVEFLFAKNLIYDNCLGVTSNLDYYLKQSLENNRRFCVLSETFLDGLLDRNLSILNATLSRILPTQSISGEWEQLESPAKRWWKLKIPAKEGMKATVIHFNILQGKLLIDGRPNGRLPEEYFNHRHYQTLLGKRIFDVIPSRFSDMSYQSKNKISGVVLHFHCHGSNLIVRKDDGEVHEFIPSTTFQNDMPKPVYITGSQWLNLNRGHIIFHQDSEWWKKCTKMEDWTLIQHFNHWQLVKEDTMLLDINYNIHHALSKALAPIEASDYIVATFDHGSGLIDISLPRYEVQFFINSDNKIESRTLRNWRIDDNQGMGTFLGLENFLKLKNDTIGSGRESILVPFGRIKTRTASSEVPSNISIDPGEENRSYTIFNIDRVLNRVLDDGSLKARYTRLYLHAVSSGILPDPLTGRSGVDEALDGLQNAASFSFQNLEADEMLILNQIASLTPRRDFYPSHLREMQTTQWKDNLPTWVQNEQFYYLVKDISKDWTSRQFLIEGSKEHELTPIGSEELLQRARNRHSAFYSGDPFYWHRTRSSSTHSLRHDIGKSETLVQNMAKSSFEWSSSQDLKSDFSEFFENSSRLAGGNNSFELTYCPEWVDIDPVMEWCSLYELCRTWPSRTSQARFPLLFILSFYVYRDELNQKLLKSLLAVAASGSFSSFRVPSYDFFQPDLGDKPTQAYIRSTLANHSVSFRESTYIKLSRQLNECDDDYYDRRHADYDAALKRQLDTATDSLIAQWPTMRPKISLISDTSLLKSTLSMPRIVDRFEACYKNVQLFQHFSSVDSTLRQLHSYDLELKSFDITTLSAIISAPHAQTRRARRLKFNTAFSLSSLINRSSPPEDHDVRPELSFASNPTGAGASLESGIETVKSITIRLCESKEDFAHKYANDLLDSVNALSHSKSPENSDDMVATTEGLDRYQVDTQTNVEGIYNKISGALSPISKSEESLWFAGLWPTISKLDILQQLRLSNRGGLTAEWTKAMIDLGKAITWQQRAERLSQLHRDGLKQEFHREAQNEGRQNWDANECLDWLLLEIDSGMMIRPVQAEIGLKMMDDTENQNAVMQLNMGEGKSAVILPAAVAALADSRKLVRSIVLKPLATQMFQILVQRLSGICNRKIYFLPFSRGLSLSVSGIEAIRALYQKCMEEGSILLTLPEHLLSFKLMGWEKMINGNIALSKPLLNTQNWLDKHTRDVLDESDEILHIRYQLIYTMGQQHTLEGNSDRWTTIQELLDLLQARVNDWLAREPRAVEVISMDAPRFPHVRIIDKSKGSEFLNDLAKEICLDNDDSVPSISSKLKLLDPKQRELAFRFISAKDISVEEQDNLLKACNSLKTQLLVLRGLIAYGILLFLLRDKRYRVDYGLDLISRRSKLAVPYRAKDQPAVKAEFGHPEVVLTLTCLTYYYGGLEDADLQSCFDILLKTDDPDLTYERWTKLHPKTPISLSKLQGLNFLDQGQVAQIYDFFRFNKDVIDFFLSELVFPREAKGFPHKLSTSGWDIAESKRNNTTGFSGTNDNRYLLPTSIKQLDLPQQLHTNSLVLTNILREENNTIIKAQSSKDKAVEMLTLTVEQSPKIQVLLDVGAAILELNNKQVAAKWLELEKSLHIEGAVFFGQDDELLVMRRDEKIESFRTSALSQQLDKVLVYLDEAHTRGTDLKLPVGTRAIVTLGPNLAKDKFVQGCMRMRKLGKGHTLAFISSPDIYAQIQKEARKSEGQEVNVSDVLFWTMLESCRQIQHGFSIWADQGFKYQRRRAAKSVFSRDKNKLKLKRGILEVESRPLIKMYGVCDGEDDAQEEEEEDEEAGEEDIEEDNEEDDEECDEENAEGELSPNAHAQTIQNRLDEFKIKQFTSIGVQEEQEREVDHEVEEEKSIERPLPATALKHTLHPAVSRLVQTGNFEQNATVFKLAFNIFAQTSCRNLLEIGTWSSDLYVTQDFAETVERRPGESIDDYLRPVRWIVYAGEGKPLVIISPWEANQLVPKFRDSKVSRLHCYAPKVSRNMQTFEFLDFCPVPSADKYDLEFMMGSDIRIQLNTFAGQLFFNDMQYYRDLQRFLGMSSINISEELKRGNDGWMSKSDLEEFARRILAIAEQTGSFSRNPAPFLAEITRMRRKGQGFSSTHLGMLLNSRILKAKDFE